MSKNGGEKNKANCKRWRERLKDDETKLQNYKLRNKERMRKARQTWRALAEGKEDIIQEKRKYNRIRQRERRQKLLENGMSYARQSQNASYECRQTLAKAVKKVEKAMPKDMHRRLKVLEVLVKKYKQFEEKKNVNQSSRTVPESLINAINAFYQNDNISVQASGKKDAIIIEGKLVAKRFMLMTSNASSHGKGAVDGVGAVIKRKVWQITKSKNVVLPDALSFYQCAQNNTNGIKMYFMPSAQIENLSLHYKLDEKWKEVKNIPGISQLHSFCCDGQQLEAARTAYSIKRTLFDISNTILS